MDGWISGRVSSEWVLGWCHLVGIRGWMGSGWVDEATALTSSTPHRYVGR